MKKKFGIAIIVLAFIFYGGIGFIGKYNKYKSISGNEIYNLVIDIKVNSGYSYNGLKDILSCKSIESSEFEKINNMISDIPMDIQSLESINQKLKAEKIYLTKDYSDMWGAFNELYLKYYSESRTALINIKEEDMPLIRNIMDILKNLYDTAADFTPASDLEKLNDGKDLGIEIKDNYITEMFKVIRDKNEKLILKIYTYGN